jgi:hypothetical protein
MITGKELKDWANAFEDDAVIGIEDSMLVGRNTDSTGWEDELEVGNLDPIDEAYD